ncbi:putative F-box/LRR-repeat protein At3g44810 [Vicia villosa]|uniref:putative F-box/LRR-repeat protein At3g44810 n=1 Tax=Vicia villosa TaxID=3911 RepID=UPI00273C69B4|nr:putative F-box/LRR-repeat protein At3g44810 [Vicia villosa]
MKRCKILNTELPDSVLSLIFSKLTLKDLVKTSALSKHWRHELGFMMKNIKDLNFDAYNMFDYNPLQNLPQYLPLRDDQSRFATGLDQLMLHYHGAMINSVRVKFPLGDQHRNVIDRLISQGVTKGVKRIELLFSHETNDIGFLVEIEPYRFSFTLLSNNTDSLMYLHLENCFLVAPRGFSGLKNLRTLVLHFIVVEKKLLQGLLSNCVSLEDFTLDDCEFNSRLKIVSPTLSHLKIVNCRGNFEGEIYIVASNLSSLNYSCNGYRVHPIDFQTQMLSEFSYRCRQIIEFISLDRLKNVTKIVLDGIDECLQSFVIPYLFKGSLQLEDVTFKSCSIKKSMEITSTKLHHLKIIHCCFGDFNPYKISIDALNLSTFEFIGLTGSKFSVVAPKLLKVFWSAAIRYRNQFGPIPKLHQIENLAILVNYSQIAKLTNVFGQLQNLRQLELCINQPYDSNMEYFSIFDILMAAQRLQKFSLTDSKEIPRNKLSGNKNKEV